VNNMSWLFNACDEIDALAKKNKRLKELVNIYHNIVYEKNIPKEGKITIPEFIRIAIKNKFECGEHFVVYKDEFDEFHIPADSYYHTWRRVCTEKSCKTYHQDLACALKRKTTIQYQPQALKEKDYG